MKDKQDYIQEIAEIRAMMERTSRFLSLSGWAGVMAGIYALTGVWITYKYFNFLPADMPDGSLGSGSADLSGVILLALIVLILAIGTAIFLSSGRAKKRGEKIWNATTRRLLINMAVPLIVGGLFILIMIIKGYIGLIAPCSLVFYGLALFNAGRFTYEEVKTLGLIQIGLGLVGTYFTNYGLILWAIGFGVVHIIYGIYLHYKYEQ